MPRAGATVLGSVRTHAVPVLEAHQLLLGYLRENFHADVIDAHYSTHYLSIATYQRTLEQDRVRLLSGALILNWICGRLLGEIEESASLVEAETWACGIERHASGSSLFFPNDEDAVALARLQELNLDDAFLDLLPYVLEIFETSDEMITALGSNRVAKRKLGVFYTPSDVADMMVENVFAGFGIDNSNDSGPPRVLDPACGTGCFLVSSLHHISNTRNTIDAADALSIVNSSLYGFDVSESALQSTAYCLALYCHTAENNADLSFLRSVKTASENLFVVDSTTISNKSQLHGIRDDLARGFDVIVSNPPYTRNSPSDQNLPLFEPQEAPASTSGTVYLSFVRMMWNLLSSERSASTMVVPLSVAFSTRPEFVDIRATLQRLPGQWEFMHFDRTPDSLFGDDVKTRNTILTYRAKPDQESGIRSTDLLRWNSRNRQQFLDDLRTTTINYDISKAIPKVGDSEAVNALLRLEGLQKSRLGRFLERVDSKIAQGWEGDLIVTSPTSYNWMSARISSFASDMGYTQSHTGSRYWNTSIDGTMSATFALIQSRLTYWQWRVWGDGFHVTDSFLLNLPYDIGSFSDSTMERLSSLGATLWTEMKNFVVEARNSGKTTRSYSPLGCSETIDEIDRVVCDQIAISSSFPNYLEAFVTDTITAGRGNERDYGSLRTTEG